MALNRWQRRRLYPPPPPTPEGMCWRSVYDSQGRPVTGLVPNKQVEAHSRSVMEFYDSLSRRERDELKRDTLHKRGRWIRTAENMLTCRSINVLQMEHFERGGPMEIPPPQYVWEQGRDYWRKRPNCGLNSIRNIATWLTTCGLSWPEPAKRKKRVKQVPK